MTQQERFLETMRGDANRPPFWEEGIQEETWQVWRAQGLSSPEAFLRRFPFDHRETVEVNLYPRPDFRHQAGPGSVERLRDRYQAAPERLPSDWQQRVARWACRNYPLGITLSRGLFQSLGVQDWETLTRVLYALCDEPATIEAVIAQMADMVLAILEQVCREVKLDFALFSEPIASFHAPVVSPAHYRRFYAPFLQQVVEALRTRGVGVLVVQTYGNVETLIPVWLELGINTLWCYHACQARIDYVTLRRRYGRELRLIGGIDSGALLVDEAAIDQALMSVVPALLQDGGYLPMLDDRVRSHVPYQNYCYYRALLTRLLAGN